MEDSDSVAVAKVKAGAACAVAAALSGKAGSGKVVAIVSGGNIDLTKFRDLL